MKTIVKTKMYVGMYKKEKRKSSRLSSPFTVCVCAKLMGLHIFLVLIFRILLHKLSVTEKMRKC